MALLPAGGPMTQLVPGPQQHAQDSSSLAQDSSSLALPHDLQVSRLKTVLEKRWTQCRCRLR